MNTRKKLYYICMYIINLESIYWRNWTRLRLHVFHWYYIHIDSALLKTEYERVKILIAAGKNIDPEPYPNLSKVIAISKTCQLVRNRGKKLQCYESDIELGS
jgi:hypothetical protein